MHNQQTIIREDNSMSKKRKLISALLFIGLALVCIVGAFLTGPPGGEKESIKEAMKDAVLHEENKVMFGPLEVNPAFLSAVTITVVILTILLSSPDSGISRGSFKCCWSYGSAGRMIWPRRTALIETASWELMYLQPDPMSLSVLCLNFSECNG